MKVNIVYEILPVKCKICNNEWVACIETEEIDWGTHKEIKEILTLECPNCLKFTNINNEKDLQ